MTAPTKPVLLTGASGNLGRHLAKSLGAQGWKLRLTDITPFPDPLPEGATFVKADLNESLAIVRQAEGCGAILHFGGVSVERPFEEILGPNLRGAYHIYEAARREGARVIFASSNHSIGFHERRRAISPGWPSTTTSGRTAITGCPRLIPSSWAACTGTSTASRT
jgi:uronate dehydrogenase